MLVINIVVHDVSDDREYLIILSIKAIKVAKFNTLYTRGVRIVVQLEVYRILLHGFHAKLLYHLDFLYQLDFQLIPLPCKSVQSSFDNTTKNSMYSYYTTR
jgi:hypothetical protein